MTRKQATVYLLMALIPVAAGTGFSAWDVWHQGRARPVTSAELAERAAAPAAGDETAARGRHR